MSENITPALDWFRIAFKEVASFAIRAESTEAAEIALVAYCNKEGSFLNLNPSAFNDNQFKTIDSITGSERKVYETLATTWPVHKLVHIEEITDSLPMSRHRIYQVAPAKKSLPNPHIHLFKNVYRY